MRNPIHVGPVHLGRKLLKSTAAVLGALLIFASLAPPFALAESDSEGEGTAPPGVLPGLEVGTGNEPAGEETILEEVAVGPGESELEEPLDPEPGVAESPPVAPPTTEEVVEPAATGEVEEVIAPTEEPAVVEPAPAPQPTPPPSYGVAETPTYEPSTSTPVPGAEPVRNEPIVAPTAPAAPARSEIPATVPAVATEPAPVAPAPAPAPSPATASVPAASLDRPGSLAGMATHTVAAGECLWFIAVAYLPAGASNAEIVAEVHRLWDLNSGSIGTGDPNLLPVGVVLRLH
jgi:hypothetical protein